MGPRPYSEAGAACRSAPLRVSGRGLVIAGAGVLVVVAGGRSEPNTATGLDRALKTLGAQPYGAALLIAAGLGIIAYGMYSFAMARYTKM
jgi:hypothetical protein